MMKRSLKPVSANPELMEKIKRSKVMREEGKALPAIANEMLLDFDSLNLILNKSPESAYELMRASRKLAVTVGSRKALVLLVDFPDKAATQTKKHYQDMLFSSGTYKGGSLTDFYKEASYNQLTITGDVFGQGGVTVGWYRAPSPSTYYTGDNFGLYGKYPNNAQKLVEDVVALAAPQVNYANYDNDHDGVVDALFVVHAGIGAEVSGKKSDIWSHQWGINPKTYNGVKVSTYSMEPEDGNIGVFCHELGHVFGLPDLYDYDYDSAGTGAWDLMAAGSWGNGGKTPVHQIGWCKTKLGWINPTVIFNSQQTVTIKPFATNAQLIKIPIGSLTSKEYFLLEYRKKVRFDSSLPGEGLLITHVDENKADNNDQTHYLVAVEQCDGKSDLEKNINSGDSTDPYPCGGNAAFSVSSNPNSKAYDGANSKITISNIQKSGDDIIATINMGEVVTPPTWYNSKKVIQTYAACSTQWAWAYISDVPGGWKQINAGSPDGVTNLFTLCCYAQAKGKSVNVYADDKYIYQMYMI